jgi:hypothetical protein
MSYLRGLNRVVANLNYAIKEIEGRSLKGLLLAVAHVRKEMDTVTPMIPVDTGNLRASWFAIPVNLPAGPAVICGFSANYAVFVHEMIGATFQRSGAGPKFFQSALRRNQDKILQIIWENAKVSK